MSRHTDWRSEFLKFCGPGVLAGITLPTWLSLLRERGGSLELKYAPRFLSISLQSISNSLWELRERPHFDSKLESISLQPPLFILGHWRSGTTWLHEILSRDERFGFANSYQVSFPHTFLSTERLGARILAPALPRHRPMDGMEMKLSGPQEDEFAICAGTLKSPCLSWVFPRLRHEFRRYLTLDSLSAAELDEWRAAFFWFLKKVQFRVNRPLVLKSPPHTARVRHLLKWFPEGKFIHIRRDPYRVIRSTLHTLAIMCEWHALQRPLIEDFETWTVAQHTEMHGALFEQENNIPDGRFHEIAFEALEKDPVGEIRRMYTALNLPDFREFEPSLRRYLSSIAGYKKNQLPELKPELRRRISRECRECFERWGYAA